MASATGATHAIELYVALQELCSALRDRVDIQAGQFGKSAVAAMPKAQGLQPGIEAALAFVERAQEQDDGCFGIVRGLCQWITGEWQSFGATVCASLQQLFLSLRYLGCAIDVLPRDLFPGHPLRGDELE